jgi:uncharacterized membrane protein
MGPVILLVVGIPLALTLWLIARAVRAKERIEELSVRVNSLELQFSRLQQERTAAIPPIAPALEPKFAPAAPPVLPPKPVHVSRPVMRPPIQPVFDRPLIPPAPALSPLAPAKPVVDWEQFMGVKGLAWIGGFTFFLGVVFAIQYSFAHHLLSQGLQAGLGFLTGLGVLAVGVVLSRKNFPALSQTLCATGILLLYAETFACRSYYHFNFFGTIPTFLLMALVTATAFLLAVRLNALVVAILGMLGGFLTPILLSTGQDNPLGLFGYIAILDAGLILLAVRRRWFFLVALAAIGTMMMQVGWAGSFFVAGKYFEGNKILIAFAVLFGFNALYLAGAWWAKTRKPVGEGQDMAATTPMEIKKWFFSSIFGLVAVALAFTAWFLDFKSLAHRPWLMFGFVFLIDLIIPALGLADEMVGIAQSLCGLAVFGLLGFWTEQWLTNELLNAALVIYFVFALLHSVLPQYLRRRRGDTARASAVHVFPLLALMLVLLPLFKLPSVPFTVWPFILLVDLLAIALAVFTGTLLSVLAVLVLTLAATGALILRIPADLAGLSASFFLLGGFVVFFVSVSVWLMRRFKPDAFQQGIKFGDSLVAPADVAAILPASSVVLPFLLLIMATLRLPLANPSPVFGLALVLVVLLLGVTKLFSLDWLPPIGLACVALLEYAWHFNRFNPGNASQPLNVVLGWYVLFFAVFAVFPFLFSRQFANKTAPWATAAMAGPPQFYLIYKFMSAVHPNPCMGLLPAVFALPPLASLLATVKRTSVDAESRQSQLAWFGGVALFFVTLIFPIQFERQWITVGWALEGAALLWLFHRVPHPGLRLTGVCLLAAAFVRLALNPAVLAYHPRAAIPIFNWYLYAYGLVIVSLFAGAKLLAPPRHLVLQSNVQPILAGLGTVLAFLLLNIEIADYFSAPGSTLTFQFSGNLGRDMTYSIAWALFALVLLVVGILKKAAAARYAAVGLLCATLLKLFFHDLAQLGQLYRIGAFIGVAVIALVASFAYQIYFSAGRKTVVKSES